MSRRKRDTSELLLAVAQVGMAHTLFGQVYEATIDIPARITSEPMPSLFAPGSPTRYFVPATPITRAALLAAVALRWRRPGQRPALAAALAAAAGDTAITVHLVRNVNSRLFVEGAQAPADQRPALLRRWHRFNALRIGAEGLAWAALASARGGRP